MKLLFTISVAIVLRSNATNYCGSTDYGLSDPIDEHDIDNCLDGRGCKPLQNQVWCASADSGAGACVPYRNDGAHCKQERVHPIPACETIFTQDAVSHAEEKWFFCAAGSEDRSLDTATEVGQCMPPESVHGEVCVNWLKWAFMQAVPKTGICFVNGLQSDKDCVEGIAKEAATTSYEVKVESQGTFQVRCAEKQFYSPRGEQQTQGNRPKNCQKTYYLLLTDSRSHSANGFSDEYLYCADGAHQWRSTPYTGAPTNAPTHEPTKEPTKEPTIDDLPRPCVDDDPAIVQVAQSMGLEVSGCDDDQVWPHCEDSQYGETIQALCCATCSGNNSGTDNCGAEHTLRYECLGGQTWEIYGVETLQGDACEWDGETEKQRNLHTLCCEDGVADERLGEFDCSPSPTPPPLCPTETILDHDETACENKCNAGSVWVIDVYQCDDTCHCPTPNEGHNRQSVSCTGPDTTETRTEDTRGSDGICTATCWANGVNNSNVESGEPAPDRKSVV